MNNAEQLIEILQKHNKSFHTVVPFNPTNHKLLRMNFTATNTTLTQEVLNNLSLFEKYISNQLKQGNYLYGIGGYAEHRTIYSISKVFDAAASNEEPRRLHLGIDIWGAAGTPVYAPLDGVVHSFAFNRMQGDYGATIILKHTLEQQTFFTLYGHLSLADIATITVGKRVARGSMFAHFGVAEENGFWPPHLHFQVIKNMEGKLGDYPGVCRFSEREKYLENCINPDVILNMLQYASS